MVNAATRAALDKQRAQEVMSPSLINSKFEGQAARYSQVMKRRNIKTGSTVSRAAQSTSMSYRSSRALELHKFNTQAHNAKNNQKFMRVPEAFKQLRAVSPHNLKQD